MLLGLTVPTHWSTVEAVLVVLCDLAGLDPDQELSGYYRDDDAPSRRESLEGAWHRALDHPDERDEPKQRVTTGADADPWATDGPGSYSDKPPF
jgi:hypothetical protein